MPSELGKMKVVNVVNFVGTVPVRIGAIALAAGMGFVLLPAGADAAVMHATSAEVIKDGPRGTANGRDDVSNAFGEADGTFFELGYEAVVEFQFGAPTGQAFFASGALIEVTFNNSPNWKEAVLIEVGRKGIADSFVAASPSPFINTDTFDNPTFTFEGTFDTVRLTDVTRPLFGAPGAAGRGIGPVPGGGVSGSNAGGVPGGNALAGNGAGSPSAAGPTGGFDVDAIDVTPAPSVTAVPLPAAGFLLVGAIGGLAALRRRRWVS
jgi:hypothetical protein